jgi:predicted methyltransferase
MNIRLPLLALSLALLGACSSTPVANRADYHAVVASPDRSADDRKTDERRKPEQLLAFADIEPGMRVLDMGAGAGYSSELIARAVGPSGVVYAQNSKEAMENIVKTRFDDRFAASPVKNVVKVIRSPEDPAPPEARNLDRVTMFLTYHDITFMKVDRPTMLKNIYAALKPGGLLVIVDHAAVAGAPIEVGKTLHRIDEAVVRREVEAAGFRFAGESDFLRHPEDPKNAPFFRMNGAPTDQFALKYLRP